MMLNFTDPFLQHVLGFEPLFDRLQRLSRQMIAPPVIHHTTLARMVTFLLLK